VSPIVAGKLDLKKTLMKEALQEVMESEMTVKFAVQSALWMTK
jgi:Cu/Ag efflux protein CusF